MKIPSLLLFILSVPLLSGCDDPQKEAEATQLRQSSFDNMVSIKGGRFQMGDFGDLVELKIPYSTDPATKPLHWVTLSDFKMGKNRVTWGEFNRWLALQGRNKTDYYLKVSNIPSVNKDDLGDDYPAQASWTDAKAYCQWLGKASQRKTDLATEAQWEYAARSGGQLIIYGNSDNKMHYETDPNRNFVEFGLPVGRFEPNPIDLYDMMGNGVDWQRFVWPADTVAAGASLSWMSTTSGTRLYAEHPGVWDFIRLLDDATVTPYAGNTSSYTLSWPTLGGTPLQYTLRTEMGEGPLALLKLRNFTLPATVFLDN